MAVKVKDAGDFSFTIDYQGVADTLGIYSSNNEYGEVSNVTMALNREADP